MCGITGKFLTVFQDSFTPIQDLCVDESLVLFKEKLNLKKYTKRKKHKFGRNLYLLHHYEMKMCPTLEYCTSTIHHFSGFIFLIPCSRYC
jgi:hypothetical protein